MSQAAWLPHGHGHYGNNKYNSNESAVPFTKIKYQSKALAKNFNASRFAHVKVSKRAALLLRVMIFDEMETAE